MADEITTSLGFEADGAIRSLAELTKEMERYNAAVREAAEGTRSFNRSGGRFAANLAKSAAAMRELSAATLGFKQSNTNLGQIQQGYTQISAGLTGVSDASGKAAQSTEKVGSSLKNIGTDTEVAFQQLREQAKAAGVDLDNLGKKGKQSGEAVLLSWKSVVRIFAIQTIHRAITLITNAFADGIQNSVEYGVALGEIQTIGQQLELTTEQIASKIRSLSDAFAQPVDVVAEGLYQTLSNQVAEGAENFEFLAAANKFAVAAVTDSASAVNLLSSTLNSYGIAASEAENVAGKLFKTIELGRIRGEEFANTFGRVTVLAAQLGISLDEVLSSIATLTVTGLKYNEAFTLINNTTLKLIRPTENLKQTYKELGVASAEAGIQAFGFQGFLSELANTTGETATEIGGLFNRVRAIRGVLGLTGSDAERFADNLKEIEAAGAGDLQDAFDEVFNTDAKQFQKELNSLKNDFIEFGQVAVKGMNLVSDAFGSARAALVTFGVAIGAAAAAYVVSVTGIIGATTTWIAAQTSLTAAIVASTAAIKAFLLTNPIGWAILAGSAVVGLGLAFNGLRVTAREVAEFLQESNEANARSAQRSFELQRDAARRTENEVLSATQRYLTEKQKLFLEDAKLAEQVQNLTFGSLASQVDSRLSEYERFVGAIRDTSQQASQAINDLQNELIGIGDTLDSFNFSRSLRGLDETQKVWAQIRRSQELARDANRVLSDGDTARAQQLLKQSAAIAKQAVSSADQSKNAANIFRAEEQVRRVLGQQEELVQRRIALERGEIAAANSIRAEEEARSVRLKALNEEAKRLTDIISDGEVNPEFDPAKTKAELKAITDTIEQELARAGANAKILERYDPDIAVIRQKFEAALRDPLTGQEVDISDAFTVSIDRILELLNRQAESIPASKKVALSKLVATDELFRGFGDAQNEIAKIPKDLENAEKATLKVQTSTKNYNDALIRTQEATASLTEKLAQLQDRGGLNTLNKSTEGFTARLLDIGANLAPVQIAGELLEDIGLRSENSQTGVLNLARVIGEAARQAKDALNPEDLDPLALNDALVRLSRGAEALRNAGYASVASDIENLTTSLKDLYDSTAEGVRAAPTAETLNPLGQAIDGLNDAFGEQGVEASDAGQDAVTASNQAADAQRAQKTATDQTTEALRRQAQAAKAAADSGEGRQHGGLIYKMFGGLIPKIDYRALGGQLGSDSVLTALTPGESVNTVDATRRFFPQIQAMNAGIAPVSRESGGEAFNFGDVNINVTEATSARDTAREVMKQIKRETRRNTFNLRRN